MVVHGACYATCLLCKCIKNNFRVRIDVVANRLCYFGIPGPAHYLMSTDPYRTSCSTYSPCRYLLFKLFVRLTAGYENLPYSKILWLQLRNRGCIAILSYRCYIGWNCWWSYWGLVECLVTLFGALFCGILLSRYHSLLIEKVSTEIMEEISTADWCTEVFDIFARGATREYTSK